MFFLADEIFLLAIYRASFISEIGTPGLVIILDKIKTPSLNQMMVFEEAIPVALLGMYSYR